MKGNQLILLVLLIAIIAGTGAYLYFNQGTRESLPAAMALPESAVIAYQGKKVKEAYNSLKQQDIYKFINQNHAVAAFEKDFRYFDSVISTNSSMQKSIDEGPLVVSLHVTSADDFQLLFLHQTHDKLSPHEIERLGKTIDEECRVIEHTYAEVKVYELKNSRKENMFAYSFMEGIIAISRNTELVEQAVKAFKANKSKNSPMVENMALAENDDKLYVNYSRLPEIINLYTSSEYHNAVKQLGALASFSEYSWKAEKDLLKLTGRLSTLNKKNFLWNALLTQKPKPSGLAKALPVGTGMFMDWCVDSFSSYFVEYKNYLKANKEIEEWEKDKTATESATGINIEKDIVSLIGSEWGYALVEPAGENTSADEILLLKPKDTAAIADNLLSLNRRAAASNQAGYPSMDYRSGKIDRISFGNSFALLLGSAFQRIQIPYYARVGDFVVFSQSLSAVEKCIDAYMDKQTLSKSSFYASFAKNLAEETNFYLYINPPRASLMGADYVKTSYKNRYNDNFPAYKGFNCFAFQLASNGKEFTNQVSLSKASDKEGSSEIAWSVALENELLGKPHIVNNFETGKKEIIVQDKNNTIYLLGNTGNILWKRKLNEPVAGDIYTMDLFKNDRSEYIFATTNKLYLIDHDGKDAGSYPLNLAEQTHAGLTLFDMNGDKEYTCLVSCDKGKIYGYNGNGKPLPGWLPMSVDAAFPYPVQAFNNNGKNYLYGISTKGTVYLWNDKGKAMIKPVALKNGFKNPLKLSLDNKTFVTMDSSGTIYSVGFEGGVRKRVLPAFRHSAFFNFIPKNEKGKPEYVLAAGNLIAGYGSGSDSSEKWRILPSDKVSIAPEIINFGVKNFIGYISDIKAKVYLFTPAGIPFANFPRTGNSPFAFGDLLGNGDIDMIIGGPNKMVYHYRLTK